MTWLRNTLVLLAFGILVATQVSAAPVTLKMADGSSLSGDVNTYTDRGLVIRMPDGQFQTVSWGKFSLEALVQLRDQARNARDREQVEPFLPFGDTGPKEIKPVLLTEPERPSRPTGTTGILGIFGSSVGLALVVILYIASFYATYEIAFYRRHKMGIALGGAAVLPVIAPIVFYFTPASVFGGDREELLEEEAELSGLSLDLEGTRLEAQQDQIKHSETNQRRRGNTAATSKAETKPTDAGATSVLQIFERGKVVFNRRFFETKLGPFLKTVPPPEAEGKQMVFETHRGVFIGKKLSAIEQSHLDLIVEAGGASSVEKIPFIEIQSARIEKIG